MHDYMRKHPETTEKKANTVKLYRVLEDGQYRDTPMVYEYDFGDCWEHEMTLVGRAERSAFFECTDGEGHGCAEDAGSVDGWIDLVEAYQTTNPNQEQREKRQWYEDTCSNGSSDGLAGDRIRQWDKEAMNVALTHI